MRIIAGSRKSRSIKALPGQNTRPTLDVVKEALFASIGPWIENKHVLDLFAGSGNIGLEALSRGADHVVFVDGSKDACQIIQENIQALDFKLETTLLRMDAFQASRYLKNKQMIFDLVYLDPPYAKLNLAKVLKALEPITNNESKIIYECLKDEPVDVPEGYTLDKTSIYGRIALYFMRRKS
jgi:16S rRNA (guanine966-N2)-methyltransferase